MDLLGQSRRRRKKPTDFASEFFELYKRYYVLIDSLYKFLWEREKFPNAENFPLFFWHYKQRGPKSPTVEHEFFIIVQKKSVALSGNAL